MEGPPGNTEALDPQLHNTSTLDYTFGERYTLEIILPLELVLLVNPVILNHFRSDPFKEQGYSGSISNLENLYITVNVFTVLFHLILVVI